MKMDPDQLLAILHKTICAAVRADSPDLSARQLTILLVITLEADMHTVRGLAQRLNISKPAISRSLDRLCDLNLADRDPDPRDRRSVLVVPTAEGAAYIAGLQALLQEFARPTTPRRASRRSLLIAIPEMVAA